MTPPEPAEPDEPEPEQTTDSASPFGERVIVATGVQVPPTVYRSHLPPQEDTSWLYGSRGTHVQGARIGPQYPPGFFEATAAKKA